ncbi:hypothetical protein BHE74_00002491 [Ensete ventricosum]|nr:hypothetical protein BHE74_00002491 [Ensete ventricosum]
MLTGSAETTAKHVASPTRSGIPPAAKATGPKKPAFKLYERRGSLKKLKMICSDPNSPLGRAAFPPRRQPEILSPSTLDLPSLTLSPVTPLIPDPFNHSAAAAAASSEKGFCLHPSPRTTTRAAEPPRLLPLFPVTSPRMPSASST